MSDPIQEGIAFVKRAFIRTLAQPFLLGFFCWLFFSTWRTGGLGFCDAWRTAGFGFRGFCRLCFRRGGILVQVQHKKTKTRSFLDKKEKTLKQEKK